MSKIDLITQDLVDKMKTITALGNRVGLAVGGTDIDPINRDLTRPAAWVIFTGTPVIDASDSATQTVAVAYTYVVKVLIDYDTESQLITTDLPILENTISTVKGTNINGLGFHTWTFGGLALESLDADRMVWILNFSCNASL